MSIVIASPVWGGTPIVIDPDHGHGQYFGCTTLAVEPAWAPCRLEGGHFHCGLDVPMVIGTPLYAARAGAVSYIGYGLLAIDVGAETDWYVHIDRTVPGMRVGLNVAQGRPVAYSGNKVPSGGVTLGPHLHFEVQTGRLNYPGSALDPEPVLRGTFGPGGGTIPGKEQAMDYWKDSEGRVFQTQREYGVINTVLGSHLVKYLVEPAVAAAIPAGVIWTSPRVAVNGVTDDWIDNSVPYGPAVPPAAPPATEPPEPTEPSNVTLTVPSITITLPPLTVPGKIT